MLAGFFRICFHVGMGTVVPFRLKTEQYVSQVISILKGADQPVTYDQIRIVSGARPNPSGGRMVGGIAYDIILYICATLIEVGLVERFGHAEGVGRPRVYFFWKANKRSARAAREMRIAA